jgi:hypothetical protein
VVNLQRHIIDKSDNLVIRSTQENDLEFITNAEREEDNAQYVGQWTKEQHLKALTQKDIMHLIVEDASSCKANLYQSEGFSKEGVLRECILYNGNYESLIVMSILEMEYYKHIS